MSQENVEVVRRAVEYLVRTGEVMPEADHPDFVWDTTTFRGAFLPSTYVGVGETNRWLAEWLSSFEDWGFEVEEVFDAGDRVVTVGRHHATPKHGGDREMEMRLAHIWTFRNDLVARVAMYADRDEALEAAGLSE
jgi:ketosteroid isomerase-like protein